MIAAATLLAGLPVWLRLLSGHGLATLTDPRQQFELMQSPALYPLWLLMPLLGGFLIAMAGGALGMAVLETEPGAA